MMVFSIWRWKFIIVDMALRCMFFNCALGLFVILLCIESKVVLVGCLVGM